MIRRRAFIGVLGGASSVAAGCAGAAAGRARAAHRCADECCRGRPRIAAAYCCVREGAAGPGMGREAQSRTEYRWADSANTLHTHATELASLAPDLILASSTPVMAALKAQTRAVPIVFVQVTDPVGQGLVSSLAHPGGNVTGFTSFEFSIGTKWLQALNEVAPRVTRVALVFNPETAPFADLFWRPFEAAAPYFAVTPISAGVRNTDELERMADALAREPNGGLVVLPDVSYHQSSRSNRCTCCTPPPGRGLSVSFLCGERRPAVLWHRRGRCFSTRGLLRRSHSQRHQSRSTSNSGADQIRTGHQSKNGQGARPHVPPTLLARADEVIE